MWSRDVLSPGLGKTVKPISRTGVGLAVAAAVAVLCSSASPAPIASAAPTAWWSKRSPFNTAITAPMNVDSRSAAWAQMLYDSAGDAGLWINTDAWTTTVYHATPKTPRVVISIANTGRRITIPYDPAWRPSPDADAHLAVIDSATGCDYEFQEFDPAHLSAHGEGTYRIYRGSGAHVPTGHTGAALSLLAGLIRPSDIRVGEVRHALALGAPVTGPSAVAPASSSDGRTYGGPPEGTRFQLDPSLNLNTLHLSRFQLIVARALQRYGMYLRDTSGSVTVYAQSTTDGSSYSLQPQPLPREILLHLRVVAPPHGVSFDSSNPARCARQR
jgi:hypothetical protein